MAMFATEGARSTKLAELDGFDRSSMTGIVGGKTIGTAGPAACIAAWKSPSQLPRVHDDYVVTAETVFKECGFDLA